MDQIEMLSQKQNLIYEQFQKERIENLEYLRNLENNFNS